jgi:malonyl CoA-acyl carrier protein transacylase
MAASGITTFVELGAKDVLTTLLKRIDDQAQGFAVGTPDELNKFAAQ